MFALFRLRPIYLLTFLVLFCAGNIPAACFVNSMRQGQDPSVIFRSGLFYMVQSGSGGINLRTSSTIAGLSSASSTIIYKPSLPEVWAPELHFFSNRWYLYYTANTNTATGGRDRRGFVAESASTSASGPYVDKGAIFKDWWNIDGNAFFYSNQLYYVFSGEPVVGAQNIYIARMSNPYTLATTPVLISAPTLAWERVGDPKVNEGPWGFQRGSTLYVAYSASGCWTDNYSLGLLTLTGSNPLDPAAWAKTGPVFSQNAGAYGPGHNSVLQDAAGQWWNIYHANNNSGEGCSSLRKIRAQRVFWNNNGTPSFGTPTPNGSTINDDPGFLTARFPLSETNGVLAASTVCGRVGTVTGNTAWMNPGLQFNGTNSWVDCGAALGNDVQHQLTLSAWIKPEAFADWAGIISKGTNVSPYALQVWHDGSLRFSANWGAPVGAAGSGAWNSNTKLTPGQWQHVTVTYDSETIRFYINGVLDSNQPKVSLRFGSVLEPLVLGADLPGGDEFFTGTIRDARVYGRVVPIPELITTPVLSALALPGADADSLQFDVTAEPNANYGIWASSNLLNWTLLFVTNPAASPFRVSVPRSVAGAGWLYRVQLQ